MGNFGEKLDYFLIHHLVTLKGGNKVGTKRKHKYLFSKGLIAGANLKKKFRVK